jgi:hypothetical protein
MHYTFPLVSCRVLCFVLSFVRSFFRYSLSVSLSFVPWPCLFALCTRITRACDWCLSLPSSSLGLLPRCRSKNNDRTGHARSHALKTNTARFSFFVRSARRGVVVGCAVSFGQRCSVPCLVGFRCAPPLRVRLVSFAFSVLAFVCSSSSLLFLSRLVVHNYH